MTTARNTLLATAGLATLLTMATPAIAQETTPAKPEAPTIAAETDINTPDGKDKKEKKTAPKETTPGKETTPEVVVDDDGNVVADIDGEKKTVTTEDEAKAGKETPKTEETVSETKPEPTFETEEKSPLADIYNGKVEFTPDMTNDAALQVTDKINEKYLSVKDQVDEFIEKNKDSEIATELTKVRDSLATLNNLGKELATPAEERAEGRTDEIIKKEMANATKDVEKSLYALKDKGVNPNAIIEEALGANNEATPETKQEQNEKSEAKPNDAKTQANRGILAATGASIIGIVALGVAIVGTGVFFLRRKNN